MNKVLVAAALATVLQCAGPVMTARAEQPLIAVFTKNFTNPAYAAARRGGGHSRPLLSHFC